MAGGRWRRGDGGWARLVVFKGVFGRTFGNYFEGGSSVVVGKEIV